MNPDRRAEIGPLPETVANPPRNGYLPRWVRVPASILIFVGAGTINQITNRAEAADLNCRVGLGLQVEPEFYAKGARISVIESGSARRQELLDPTRERVIDLGVAPSNTTRDGKAARVVVHFAADEQGRQLTPRKGAEVNCGRLEHVRYILNREVTPVAPAATPASTSLPSVTPTPDRVATLEAQLRGIYATATRTVENEQLASAARAKGEANARATITAEAQATAVVRTLIQEAEKRGRESYIATATAVVSPTAGAAGIRPGDDSKIPSIPWIPLAGGLGILALIGAEFIFQKVRHTTGNIIKFPYRAFRRFILKQAGTQLWP